MDYSLPIARRTRQRQEQFYKEYFEERKRTKAKNDAVVLSSASGPSVPSSEKLTKEDERIEGSANFGPGCTMEREAVAVSDESGEESVEEIDGKMWGKFGADSVDFASSESSRSKNVNKIEVGFEETVNDDIIDLESSDDEVIWLDEEEGVGSEHSNFSIFKSASAAEDETNGCVHVDNEAIFTAEEFTRSDLNSDVNERDVVSDNSNESETSSEETSSDEEDDDLSDEDYTVDSDKDKRGRLKCVAFRTRSRFSTKLKRKHVEFGTISRPLCVDEEEEMSLPIDDNSELESDDKSLSGTDSDSPRKVRWKDEHVVTLNGKLESADKAASRIDSDSPWRVCKKDYTASREFTKGKNCGSAKEKIDVLNILVDSILANDQMPLEELLSSTNQVPTDERRPCVSEMSIPLKFTFGTEESDLTEKSDDENELDKLWAELDFALRSSEIGFADTDMVENEDAFPIAGEVNQTTLCGRGAHQLILDEQIGLKCSFCSYVKLEIKYIVPSFDTSPLGKSYWRDPGLAEYFDFDDLQHPDPGCDRHTDSYAHSGGTVWDIIPGIKNSMYPHQREGFEFIWKNIAGGIHLDELKDGKSFDGGSGCIISHAPGTGKTRLTIVFLQTYMELYPTCRPIIIAPSSMLLTWEEEFQKWKFHIPFHNLLKPELSGKENMAAANILMQAGNIDNVRTVKMYSWSKEKSILGISYRLFEQLVHGRNDSRGFKIRKILLEFPGLVVLDEGHIPRNDDSRIFKALSLMKTERRIILSGTPFQNNFLEFYNTLCLARPRFEDMCPSVASVEHEKRCGRRRKESRRKWDTLTSPIGKAANNSLGCASLQKLKAMIDPFIHIHRGTILQEKLPGLRDAVVILNPLDMQKSLLKDVHELLKKSFELDFIASLISVHPSLLLNHSKNFELGVFKYSQQKNPVQMDTLERLRLNPEPGVKVKFLMELVRLSEALNEKVLVFSQYIEPLSFIIEHLVFHFNWVEGKEVFYMDGQCDLKKRQSLINTFNDPTSEVRVLLASTRASSEGINLVGASRVVLLDVLWNPSVERQAICRAYRLGQEKVVYTYHLLTSGSREEEKYSRQVEKDRLSALVFSSSDKGSGREKLSPTVLEDKVLEAMVQHEKIKHIFERIVCQSKEFDLVDNFW